MTSNTHMVGTAPPPDNCAVMRLYTKHTMHMRFHRICLSALLLAALPAFRASAQFCETVTDSAFIASFDALRSAGADAHAESGCGA